MIDLKTRAFEKMNKLGSSGTPFLFVLDFEMEKPIVVPLHELDQNQLKYAIEDGFLEFRNFEFKQSKLSDFKIEKMSMPFSKYEIAFEKVKSNLQLGNSFLTNLTGETLIKINQELDDLLNATLAKYKLYLKDQFVCFSPETFVQIDEYGVLSSFPMKGTIDAHIPNAKAEILADKKELYEHTTIVDLIRNDLSSIATKVWVERFRYVEKIKKEDDSELLQVSSQVKARLDHQWQAHLGDIFEKLLPAGSISGAPKGRTIEIIKEAEEFTYANGRRGYYTGVFGVFSGERLSSAVIIRFIEKRRDKLYYKSGGGITSRSEAYAEYQEMLSKIYVPLH